MNTSPDFVKVTVCVGSSCHVRGSRSVLARFGEIFEEEDVPYQASLVGCFCMDRCGETMNWKFGDQEISSASVEEAEQTLREKLEEFLGARGPAKAPPRRGE